MSPHEDLDAQLAQRLLGWRRVPARPTPWWRLPEGAIRYGAPPAFSTDPAATALVWQWLETQLGGSGGRIAISYWDGQVTCQLFREVTLLVAHQLGTTWPEALCRAALALAASLEETR